MNNILILGCGYVGSAFAIAAKAHGHQVRAVTRNAATVKRLRSQDMIAFEGRVDASDWHDFAGEEIDWVLNCVSASAPGIEGYRSSYIDGNRSVANWMKQSGFGGKAIYTSSVSVYPDRGGEWCSETDARGESERSRVMLESEKLFLEGARSAQASVLRLGGIYGPGRSFLVDRIRQREGSMPGFGDYYLNLIRLEDVVSALESVFSGEGVEESVFNVVDDEPLFKADLVESLAHRLEVSRPVFDGASNGEGTSRRWENGRPSNRRISNRLLRTRFGWRPRFSNAIDGMGNLLSD